MDQQPQRPGWWSRNWKWALPVICVAGAALAALCVAGFVWGILGLTMGAMKSSGAYKHSMAMVRADPTVAQALGSPLKEGFFLGGSVSATGDGDYADPTIPISGPNGEAKVHVEANSYIDGMWRFDQVLVVVKKTGQEIDVLKAWRHGRLEGYE